MTLQINASTEGRTNELLSTEALLFLGELHDRFEKSRRELLERRKLRQDRFNRGELPDFLPATAAIRSGDWQVAHAPPDLLDRRVEITGPTDRKMVINALNSGAKVFMADFEDANTPTWQNMIEGQANLFEAVRRTLGHEEDGKTYELATNVATLVVRPRGWHLTESHVSIGNHPMSASLFDAGLYLLHNASELLKRGSGPYFYLPKLESHEEARLWNDVFVFAQERIGIPQGSIRATVLIETITAAFEMEEILYELREHSSGLNAGRWDYIFSIIKKFRTNSNFILPDRSQVTMATPFMSAYAQGLVKACHRRRAHAIGGMSAFIPSRRDPAVNARALPVITVDKQREGGQGFDGAWVAHPDLVPVVRDVFDAVLGDRENQVDRLREDIEVSREELLDIKSAGSDITEDGLRSNIAVGVLYLNSWLQGRGAAALFNLMEDTATAEISRSQVWQWLHHRAHLGDGSPIERNLVEQLISEEADRARDLVVASGQPDRLDDARALFEEVALGKEFVDFLTVPGIRHLRG